MTVLNLKDFFSTLDKNGWVENGIQLNDKLTFNGTNYTWDHRIIKHVRFKQVVVFEDFDLVCGVSFEHCSFENGVVFKNTKVTKYDNSVFPINSSIHFYDCSMIGTLYVTGSELHRAITISSNSKFANIIIEHSDIGNGGISINNSSVSGKVDIENTVSSGISVSNSTIEGVVRFNGVKSSISFVKSVFSKWLKFFGVHEKATIIFNENQFQDTINIEGCDLKGVFFHGDEFRKEVIVELSDNDSQSINEIFFSELKFSEGFSLLGNGRTLQSFDFPLNSAAEGIVKIEDCFIQRLQLKGINENVKLIFKEIVFENLELVELTNLSDITFSKCKGVESGALKINDSDLGEMKFNNFSFRSFGEVLMDNVFLNKIVTFNIDWFEDEQLSNRQDEFDSIKNKRQIYSQLKQALKSNGNQIDSLLFKAKEMFYFREEKRKKPKSYSLGDRLIMCVNSSNNFGLVWLKPLIILLIINIVFFGFISIADSDRFSFKPNFEWNNFKSTFEYFFSRNELYIQLLNPVRKVGLLYETESRLVIWLDYCQRVFLGVLIYQIIAGFRRYASKK